MNKTTERCEGCRYLTWKRLGMLGAGRTCKYINDCINQSGYTAKTLISKKLILVEVDMIKYCEVFDLPYHGSRRLDYTHDYEPMQLTPAELRDFINRGIDIKLVQQ